MVYQEDGNRIHCSDETGLMELALRKNRLAICIGQVELDDATHFQIAYYPQESSRFPSIDTRAMFEVKPDGTEKDKLRLTFPLKTYGQPSKILITHYNRNGQVGSISIDDSMRAQIFGKKSDGNSFQDPSLYRYGKTHLRLCFGLADDRHFLTFPIPHDTLWSTIEEVLLKQPNLEGFRQAVKELGLSYSSYSSLEGFIR